MDMEMDLQILCDPGWGPVVGNYGHGNGLSGSIKTGNEWTSLMNISFFTRMFNILVFLPYTVKNCG